MKAANAGPPDGSGTPQGVPSTGNLSNVQDHRLSQDFVAGSGVKKALTKVPVRRPSRQQFVRVKPGPDYYYDCLVVKTEEDSKYYLVGSNLHEDLRSEAIPVALFTAVDRQGTLFLWPVKLPDHEGKLDDWNRSALDAAEVAKSRWIRLVSNRGLGAYDVYEAADKLSDPEWPDLSVDELVRLAFKDHFISSYDHPVVRQLKGRS